MTISQLRRLLSGIAVVLLISSAAMAQRPSGTVKRFSLKSTVLGEDRVILVRTPVGYETNKLRYPVLYMTDGDAHIGHTASTIEFLENNGRAPDLIVVGVTNTDRTRDLTPAKSTQKNAAGELQFPTAGGADNFLKFFETGADSRDREGVSSRAVSHSRRALVWRAVCDSHDDGEARIVQLIHCRQPVAAMGERGSVETRGRVFEEPEGTESYVVYVNR